MSLALPSSNWRHVGRGRCHELRSRQLQDYNYEDGLVFYKGLIYVPKNDQLKRRIVQEFHDGLMGHPGQWKTIELISREYYWLGMSEFVKEYIKGCAICQ